MKMNRYQVTLYHGGEGCNEVRFADSLIEAFDLGAFAEHIEVVDLLNNELIS